MPRHRLRIAYEGTCFHGWQRQFVRAESAPSASVVDRETGRAGFVELRTVQWAIGEAVFEVFRERAHVQGASRTDAGVHARAQTAAFSVSGERGPSDERVAMALNSRLPSDVLVTACERVGEGFDPIAACESKGYRYTVVSSPVRPLWDRRTVYHVREDLDVGAMREAGSMLVGEHDFAGFAQAKHGRESTVRRVHACDVGDEPRAWGGRTVWIDISGDGFLYNMVRIIAGTLVEVGRGRMSVERVREALERGDRRLAGPTLGPAGLCLMWMRYGAGCAR